MIGTTLCDPRGAAGRARALDHGPVLRAPVGRLGRGHGLSHHAGADHGAVVGSGAHALDRAVVGLGGAISALGPAARGRPAHTLPVGLGVPHHAAARVCRALWQPGAMCPRTSTRPSSRVDNFGGVLSVIAVASLILAINFAPVPERGHARPHHRARDRGRRRRLRAAPAPSAGAAVRPDVASRRVFWVAALARASSCSARSWARCSSASSSCRTCSATPPWTRALRSCRRPCSWS